MALITAGPGGTHATLAAAKAAASAGDTITVYPGTTFNENNLAKNGVNWFFYPGTKIVYTGASAVGIFDDGGAAMSYTIGGYGWFENNTSGVDASSHGCLYVGHASSVVTAVGSTFKGTADDSAYASITCADGFLSVTCHDLISSGAFGVCLLWVKGEFHVTAPRIITPPNSASYCIWAAEPLGGASANMYVRANLIENVGYAAVTMDGRTDNYKLWVESLEIRGTLGGVSNASIECLGGGKLYVRTQKLASNTACGFYMTGGEAWIDIEKMSCDLTSSAVSNQYPQHLRITGGTLHDFKVGHFETVGAVNAGTGFSLEGGTSRIRGGNMKILNGLGVNHSGGTHSIEELRIDTSNTNASGNHCVSASAAGLILRNTWLVAPALAKAIAGASASTVLCKNVAANRPRA